MTKDILVYAKVAKIRLVTLAANSVVILKGVKGNQSTCQVGRVFLP